MKQPPKIDVYWDNPPGRKSGLTIQRALGEHVYERKVPSYGRLSSTEAAAALGISLRHLYNLVNDGKLKSVRKGDRHSFRLLELKRYLVKQRGDRGRREPWLIG